MTWSAVGTWHGSNTAALTLSNQAAGNLLVVEVLNFSNSTVWCTGLTGGGATWVQAGVKFSGTTIAASAAVFLGTVTATGAQTATPTWSGTTPASYTIAGNEFHSTAGSWAFDKQGNLDSSGTANWPSLTPGFGAGELYFGYAINSTTAVAGSTSGYIYNANVDTNSDGAAYNVNCPGSATFPVWGDSLQQLGIMILVAETAAAGGAVQARPGRTWLRRFHHPQQAFPPPAAATAAAVVQPVNAAVAMRTPASRRQPRQVLTAGTQVPPVVVVPVRQAAPRIRRQPPQRLRTGMLPGTGLSGIPPMSAIRPRLVRLPVRPRGSITGPLAPGAVAVVTPVRVVVLAVPRRGPPAAARSRILPGQRGSLTVPVPVPVVPRHRQRVPVARSRLIPSPFTPAGVVYQAVSAPTRFARTAYRLQRQPPQRLRTGMLPGTGLSGIPVPFTRSAPARVQRQPRPALRTGYPGALTVPVPVPVVPRHRQKIRPVTNRIIAGIVIPAAGQPVMAQQARLRPVLYRLVRRPAGSLRTGMLPGLGLSGIPPASLTRPRQARAVPLRVRSQVIPGIVPAAAVQPVMRQQARLRAVIYRLVRRPRGTLTPGIVPPPPPAFTIGALTAADKASGVLTAAGASSALTATTAPGSTLTAGDQRTGGPT